MTPRDPRDPSGPRDPRDPRGDIPSAAAGDPGPGAAPDVDPGPDRDPAPVVTDEGTFGELPEPVSPADLEEESWARPFVARIAAWLLVLVGAAGLLVLGGWQITGRAVAIPALERGTAALTQIDELLALHHTEVVAAGASRATEPGATVALPGFPVPSATLTALEARDGSTIRQRELLLGRAADALYAHGTAALVEPKGSPQHASIFSTAGATRRLLGALSAADHDRLAALLWPLAAIGAALAAAVLLLGRGLGRFVALGAALLGAAALAFAATVLARTGVAVVGTDGSALAGEVAAITRTLVWTPARDAAWLALAGVAIALPAMLARLLVRAPADEDEDAGGGYARAGRAGEH